MLKAKNEYLMLVEAGTRLFKALAGRTPKKAEARSSEKRRKEKNS
jgi:hypothetical protein